jgi:hypothetical protein
MRIIKPGIEQWHYSYHRFTVSRGWWLMVAGAATLIASALLPHGTLARGVGIAVGALCVAAMFSLLGGDVALLGFCLFGRRYQQSLASAICGLALCLLCAVFLMFSGVAGFVMAVR